MSPQMRQANEVLDRLKVAADRAEAASKSIDARIEAAAAQAVERSIAQIESHTATLPPQVEEACKAAVTRMEEEVEAKKAEATHSTIESLYKAADWYQKKSQTGMQTALERTVEQSATSMRDRAAETSQAFTTELEHYTRSYVDLARSQIDDATKQAAERNREQLAQSTQTAAAGFQDELHRTASQNLQRFEQSAHESLELIVAEMARRQATSLQEFDRRIEERITAGVQQAHTHLEARLAPLMDSWQEKQQAAQRESLAQFEKASDETISQFRARLENASNSWLLASATTLGQRSQAVIETLGLAAEKRLREICANVMSSVGETLRDRLSTGAGRPRVSHFSRERSAQRLPPVTSIPNRLVSPARNASGSSRFALIEKGKPGRCDLDHPAVTHLLARDESAIARILPNRELGTGCAPRVHHFVVAPLAVGHRTTGDRTSDSRSTGACTRSVTLNLFRCCARLAILSRTVRSASAMARFAAPGSFSARLRPKVEDSSVS